MNGIIAGKLNGGQCTGVGAFVRGRFLRFGLGIDGGMIACTAGEAEADSGRAPMGRAGIGVIEEDGDATSVDAVVACPSAGENEGG